MIDSSGNIGLWIQGNSTLVQGNLIGLNAAGTSALGNAGGGIVVSASGNTIGGTTPAARNVISGNTGGSTGIGISILSGTADNLIEGNYIGTNATGTAAVANVVYGIGIQGSSGNTIGGATLTPGTGAGNLISGNANDGVNIGAGTTDTSILGNIIGLDETGTIALGNGSSTVGNGVTLDGSLDTIGGTIAADRNIISGNYQLGGMTTVTGTLNSTPGTNFTLDFYTLSSTNASGYGEGHTVLGSWSVMTDGAGNTSFSTSFATPAGGARFVTATATDSGGNTSEFSKEFGVVHAPTVRIGFTTLTVNEGSPVKFDGSASTNPDGDPLSYAWTFGDLTSATGPDPTHTYLAPGTDTVTLTVNDGFGGVSSAQATITVVDVPPVFTPDSFTPPLTYTTATPGSGFGASVASVDGNVAIGAPSEGNGGEVYLYDGVPTDNGVSSTYVYSSLIHTFADPNPAPGDEFGASLAVVGNELVVGAPGSSISGTGNGVAYVFDANSDSTTFGNLLATLAIPAPVAGTGAQFGASVGTTNTNIVIGAPGTNGGQGEVYEFEGDTTQSNFGDLLLSVTDPHPGADFSSARPWRGSATI